MSELRLAPYVMPAASLGPENPLPDLAGVGDAHAEIVVDKTTVSAEEAKYMGWGRVHTILPYTIQDGFGRRRHPRAFQSVVLENEYLKAIFLPELGGRLWSLFDKKAQRELLHVNPVFQPCNLALREAWISGGVEWNVGMIGHTPFTVDDMATEILRFADGTPALRMYQYERVRHLFYRVEAFLPDGAKELYVRVRIDNATKEDTAVYWWSNMAVNERPDVRVIVPADKAFRYGYGGKLAKIPVPRMVAEEDKLFGEAARLAHANGGSLPMDITRTMQLPQAMDFFFDVPGNVRPFIAAPDQDGYGICQTSTGELRGRKLFVWGMGRGGRHWQSFLSKPGSAYIELQSGLAHTQLEHLPMAGGASISWLESYGPVHADPGAVHGENWREAVNAVSAALDAERPADNLENWHARVKAELDGACGKVIHQGMGYAHAEKALLGAAFDTAGLSLAAMRRGPAEKLWINLAEKNTFPRPNPLNKPLSYAIGFAWEEKLRCAAQGGSDSWFARYHLGVMADARGDSKTAAQEYELSLRMAENPWALRCLALKKKQAGHPQEAAEMMCRAAHLRSIRPLVLEALEMLMTLGRWQDMLDLLNGLSASLQANGRVKTFRIAALMRLGRVEEARKILDGPIVLTDVREGNTLLTDQWFESVAIREKGIATPETIAWAKENFTPPIHLDFRMT